MAKSIVKLPLRLPWIMDTLGKHNTKRTSSDCIVLSKVHILSLLQVIWCLNFAYLNETLQFAQEFRFSFIYFHFTTDLQWLAPPKCNLYILVKIS
jgi:hypothetical protein